jgi:hypothetical protein
MAGPCTLEQWNGYLAALGKALDADDEALVDSLVRPRHPSTPGYNDPHYRLTGRKTRTPEAGAPAAGHSAGAQMAPEEAQGEGA